MEKILVPIDLHEESSWGEVLPVAVDEVRHRGAELNLLTVVPKVELNMPGVPVPENLEDMFQKSTLERLETLAKKIVPKEIDAKCILGVGSTSVAIIDAATNIGATLIVMASHRPSLKTYILGASAAQVARHAPCSVYIVRCH
ncbi:MAG: universal stress protein [Alphaproteobacteria bacterium]|nr:universal stress protein [Alphaproteobacteria bacterium]